MVTGSARTSAFPSGAGGSSSHNVEGVEFELDASEAYEHVGVVCEPRRRASEIAQRTRRSRQFVDQLIKGQRGPGNFPAPAGQATRNPLWRWSEVDAWFAAYRGRVADTERTVTLGAINGALRARHSLRRSAGTGAKQLRRALQHLVAS